MNAERQCTSTVFVVRPCRFQANPLTADSNAFQAEAPWDDLAASNRLAQQQFDGLVGILERAGVECIAYDDTPEPHTPDSIFPNNWIITHADGTVVLSAMEAPNRRDECRPDIVDDLREAHGFVVRRTVDLRPYAEQGHFLEGTGSLVLDRVNRVAYACRSSRTEERMVERYADAVGYTPVLFDALDRNGQPIYHTNVVMWIGSRLAAICSASLPDGDRARVLDRMAAGGHEVIDLSLDQLESFAGNMLEVRSRDGDPVIAMSQQAFDSLDPAQRERLEANAALAVCPIGHIETQSGGSVRCMLAEVHLPRLDAA